MKMSKLFDNSDSDSEARIRIDNEFAKNYDKWRRREELHKYKAKYGDENLDEEDSSSSSEEDEDGTEWTEEVDKEFFKTLACLKKKDPRIYDENVKFFDSVNTESIEEKKKTTKKEDKPMTIKDYERKLLLEKGGQISDEDDVDDGEKAPRAMSPTYVEEQAKLKDMLKKQIENSDDEDEGDATGGMFKARTKTKEELEREEADFKKWLAGKKESIDDNEIESELKVLKDYWNDPNLDKNEQFIRNYILNEEYLKNEIDSIPTYEEIVHDSDEDLSEDERTFQEQENFEHKYNFRFEEPDQEFIKRFPRTIENSLRKTDDKRKLKRLEVKERKQREKEQKKQELMKLQEMKLKEIEEKIEQLKEVTGNETIGFNNNDLDDDFDPDEHDRRMQALFNDDYYQQGENNDRKPEFPEIDELLEVERWDKWGGEDEDHQQQQQQDGDDNTNMHEPHCEDEDFNMDCDYDPNADKSLKNEILENSKGRKKRKRKSLFAKVVSQPKPVFDPNDKTYEEYLDEYYKLDCEDIIGDLPCRFKYRQVVPNSFGLTIEEILLAKDRELNRWCSLKKAVQQRPDHIEKYDQIAYQKKAQNIELKRKILPSLFEETNDGVNDDVKQQIEDNNNQQKKEIESNIKKDDNESKQKKKKRKRKSSGSNAIANKKPKGNQKKTEVGLSDARLSAYGINPKKFKNKIKYRKDKK